VRLVKDRGVSYGQASQDLGVHPSQLRVLGEEVCGRSNGRFLATADEAVWVPTVFTKNRDRLLAAEVARRFLAELLNHEEVRSFLSNEHFSVDGTQAAAWASMKSFRAKDGSDEPQSEGRNGERNCHGEKRSNETRASTTDREANTTDPEAKLSYAATP
jgi:hypothetical protein